MPGPKTRIHAISCLTSASRGRLLNGMSTGLVQPMQSARPRRRRLRWLMLGALAVFAGGVCLYVYVTSDGELRDAIAEADRLDSGWRFEEMEAARAAVPDAENGALVVLAARALMPVKWMVPPPTGAPSLEDRLAELSPLERPNFTDLAELRAELAKAAAALEKARQLADLPRGRYQVAWNDDLIGVLVPHVFEPRIVARMLAYDALLRSQDGDVEGAVRSCRAALNAGRSLGDEPLAISHWVRAVCAADAVRALERTLATGAASAKLLETMQQALAVEAEEPLLLRSARAERVCYFQPLDRMRTGQFDWASFKLMPSRLGATADDLIARRQAAACEAAYLRYSTALVEIVKLPPHLQETGLQELTRPQQPLPALMAGLMGRGGDWVTQARGFHRIQAELHCATAALAAERYRLAEGRWPDHLDALVPRYLNAVPIDPFDGRPLRLCRPLDGLIVYSVGPDRVDNGGRLNRAQPGSSGSDVGFQLWECDRRRAPP
jgi:hypothetical protein